MAPRKEKSGPSKASKDRAARAARRELAKQTPVAMEAKRARLETSFSSNLDNDQFSAAIIVDVGDDRVLRARPRRVRMGEEHVAGGAVEDAEHPLVVVDHFGATVAVEVEYTGTGAGRGVVFRVRLP